MGRKDGQSSSIPTRRSKRRLPESEESEESETSKPVTIGSTIKVRIVDKETIHNVELMPTTENKDHKTKPSNDRSLPKHGYGSDTVSVKVTEAPVKIPLSVERRSQDHDSVKIKETSQDTMGQPNSTIAVESPSGNQVLVSVQIPFLMNDKTKSDAIRNEIKPSSGSERSLLKELPSSEMTCVPSTSSTLSTVNVQLPSQSPKKPSICPANSSRKESLSQLCNDLSSDITPSMAYAKAPPQIGKSEPKKTNDQNAITTITVKNRSPITLPAFRDESVVVVDVPNTIAGLEMLPGVSDEEKLILEILPKIKEGEQCLPFCASHCDVNHHPLLIALNQCREENGQIELKQRLFMLESIIFYYYKKVRVIYLIVSEIDCRFMFHVFVLKDLRVFSFSKFERSSSKGILEHV